ncbi:ABC transporter permease subunit [Glycomyces arizonensis]|uniref:ABC transporter permease subunit n=1 Tax=Glycomyces arizonensis TaxID=256035 RepID=UPI000406C53F|nr:ABC transporter permease subunit [Glycomyces arizonensis]
MSALGSAIAAEWVKVRSVRSTVITLGLFAAVALGLSWMVARAFDPGGPADDAILPVSFGLLTGQLVLVTFAVATVGSEFSTGTIRASLAAVPSRGRLFAAKMTAVGLTVGAAALIVESAVFALVRFTIGDGAAPLTEWWTIEVLLGGWIHLTLLSVFTAAVAVMVRSTVIALSVLLPILFLSSQGLGNVEAIKPVAQYLPDQVGMVIMHMTVPGDPQFGRDYSAWGGIGILVLWTAAALAAAWWSMRRRDA